MSSYLSYNVHVYKRLLLTRVTFVRPKITKRVHNYVSYIFPFQNILTLSLPRLPCRHSENDQLKLPNFELIKSWHEHVRGLLCKLFS